MRGWVEVGDGRGLCYLSGQGGMLQFLAARGYRGGAYPRRFPCAPAWFLPSLEDGAKSAAHVVPEASSA